MGEFRDFYEKSFFQAEIAFPFIKLLYLLRRVIRQTKSIIQVFKCYDYAKFMVEENSFPF